MGSFFRTLAASIDRINEFVGRSVAWLTTALVVITVYDVLSRYLFSATQAWIMELEWHLFALVFLLGAGYALLHDRHVRVDLFYSNFSARQQALVNFWGGILFLVPWCALMIWAVWPYALGSFRIGEGSPDPGGLPARWVIKFALVGGLGLLGMQGLSQVIRSGLVLWGKTSENQSE